MSSVRVTLRSRPWARAKGLRDFRVDWKRNGRGELVIALIVKDKDGPLSRANVS
jgi:hypothetical protein